MDAADHFVEHDAERENVGPLVEHLPATLLRRHVAQGSGDESRMGQQSFGAVLELCAFQVLGQAKIDNLDMAVAREHHVGRLQVAVDHPGLVRARQRFRDFQAKPKRL